MLEKQKKSKKRHQTVLIKIKKKCNKTVKKTKKKIVKKISKNLLLTGILQCPLTQPYIILYNLLQCVVS